MTRCCLASGDSISSARKSLQVLIVEDSPDDAELVERELGRGGYDVFAQRVADAPGFMGALAERNWDVILADYMVPGFGALTALEQLKQTGHDIPFIIVSGAIDDETAVRAMRAGAHDYVLKGKLVRLIPAIEREMQEAVARRKKREVEATLRLQAAALQAAANAIVITDRRGSIEWVNSAFTKLTGYTEAEALGRNPRVLNSGKQDAEFFQKMWETILGGDVWRGEVTNRRKDATLYVEEMTITPVRSKDGTITHFVAVKEDISERKRVERDIAHKASFPRLNPSPIIETDLEGAVVYANPAARTQLLDAAGGDSRLLLPDFPEILAEFKAGGKESASREIEVHGRVFQKTFHYLPELGVVRVYVLDITELKLAEQALLRSEKLAALGRMAATIAHEVNNPLAGAMNAIYIASSDESVSPQTRRALEIADEELRRAAHMTSRSLSFYREQTSRAPVQLPNLIEDIVALYAKKLQERRIKVERRYRCCDCPSECFVANAGELRQVVSNLLINGMDALRDDGTLHIRLVRFSNLGGHEAVIRFTIADTGSGIRTEHLQRIFEPFFTTKQAVGTGLGLWISQEIIRRYGGSIRIRSKHGKGTVCCVTMPAMPRNNGSTTDSQKSGVANPHCAALDFGQGAT